MIELNKIHLGDAYELIKEIPNKSIDLVITDPPYFYSHHGGGCFGLKNRKYQELDVATQKQYIETLDERKTRNRNDITSISYGFDFSLLDELDRIMKKINIYIWCSKSQVRKILEHYEDKGCAIDILTWHKTNPTPTMNNTYANDTEYCIFAREKGVKVGGSYETKRKYYITGTNKSDKDEYLHPTIKPIHIIKNLIINSSQENDLVLDCFMGSGTTAVACKELNRQFIGFEIDEKWHKIANERLSGLTQEDVKKKEEGQMTLFD